MPDLRKDKYNVSVTIEQRQSRLEKGEDRREVPTEVFWQEDNADSIYQETDDLRKDHVHMPRPTRVRCAKYNSCHEMMPRGRAEICLPCRNLDSNHDKLVKNQCGEGD